MTNYFEIAQKLGYGFLSIVLLNILAGIFMDRIFRSVFTSFWIFTIGLALVIYPAVLKNRNKD